MMDEARRTVADKAYMDYDFGNGVEVEDASGWEQTTHGREWVRPVFVRTDEGDTSGDASTKLTFTVRFNVGEDSVEECYAMDKNGTIWGKQEADMMHIRLVVDASYQCSLDEASDMVAWIEQEIARAIGSGLLSNGQQTPKTHEVQLFKVGNAAMNLDEDDVRDWVASTIESGNMKLEDVPKLMGRYALSDSFQMRDELTERMGVGQS